MNLEFYRNRYEDVKTSYHYYKRKMIITAFVTQIIFWPLTIILFTFSVISGLKDTISIVEFIVSTFTFMGAIFSLVFIYNNKRTWVKTTLMPFIFDLVNKENNHTYRQILDDKESKKMIIASRLVNKSDGIIILNALAFETTNGKQGYYFRFLAERSNGKSSVTVANGELIIFKTNTENDFQLRNDNYGMEKGRRDRSKESIDYHYYHDKNIINSHNVTEEVQQDFIKLRDVYMPYNKYDVKKTKIAVNYQRTEIAIYGFYNEKVDFPKTLDETTINNIYLKTCKLSDRIEMIAKIFI